MQCGQAALARKYICGFADWAGNIGRAGGGGVAQWQQLMMRAVDGGARKRVHATVDDDGARCAAVAHGQHCHQQRASICQQAAAGFQQQAQRAGVGCQPLQYWRRKDTDVWHRFSQMISNRKTAT